MPKPAQLPRWADDGGDIVEPTDGKKDVGWLPGEQPPAQYANWLANLNFQWAEWFSDRFHDDGTPILPGARLYHDSTDIIVIPGAAFQVIAPNYASAMPAYDVDDDEWAFSGTSPPNDRLMAPIILPFASSSPAEIVGVSFEIHKGGNANGMTGQLYVDGSVIEAVTDTGTENDWKVVSLPSGPSYDLPVTISGDAQSVYLVVQVGHASHRFRRAFIEYRRPTP